MSPTLAALDSLAATLVPKLPAASQVALQKTAHYYAVQAAATDIGALLGSGILFLLIFRFLIPGFKKADYSALELWVGGAFFTGIGALALGIYGTVSLISDIAFFSDPVTGTILRLLGK